MCFGGPPSPPPLPEPRPTAPRPEPTAERVAVGRQRVGQQTAEGQRRRKTPTQRSRRRLGTASLRIPLVDQEQMGTGNLRY